MTQRRRPARVLLTLVLGVGLALGWGELIQWRSTQRRLGTEGSLDANEVVVVLGYRNPGRINFMNRYRVRAGIRSISRTAEESTLLMCGGAVAGSRPEAELMERYARGTLGYTGRIAVETRSRSTWENIENALVFLESADAIKIVSIPVHAEKARAHLWQLRPDLAARLVRAEDYRFGEITVAKFVGAIIGLRHLRKL